eukprot:16336-Heterococcus_DN1.PRE.2
MIRIVAYNCDIQLDLSATAASTTAANASTEAAEHCCYTCFGSESAFKAPATTSSAADTAAALLDCSQSAVISNSPCCSKSVTATAAKQAIMPITAAVKLYGSRSLQQQSRYKHAALATTAGYVEYKLTMCSCKYHYYPHVVISPCALSVHAEVLQLQHVSSAALKSCSRYMLYMLAVRAHATEQYQLFADSSTTATAALQWVQEAGKSPLQLTRDALKALWRYVLRSKLTQPDHVLHAREL